MLSACLLYLLAVHAGGGHEMMWWCRGKWAHADQKEVDDMLAQGKPHCYRFRVPANQTVTITDCIRGKVSWNTDTLGDFVVMRSNGLPVYNFCVAVDDALMKISHVIRAEEHLPNTLRQVSFLLIPYTNLLVTGFSAAVNLISLEAEHMNGFWVQEVAQLRILRLCKLLS